MGNDIVLTSGVRANLLQLQRTSDLITSTQTRLATGKRVNNALDNPVNFFTAAGLQNRASDLGNLLAYLDWKARLRDLVAPIVSG